MKWIADVDKGKTSACCKMLSWICSNCGKNIETNITLELPPKQCPLCGEREAI
jgi:rubrerythrin